MSNIQNTFQLTQFEFENCDKHFRKSTIRFFFYRKQRVQILLIMFFFKTEISKESSQENTFQSCF